jgi:hypothetical protein
MGFDSPAWRGEHQIGFALGCDMNQKKRPPPNPVNPVNAAFILFWPIVVARHLGADHPEVGKAIHTLGEDLRRQYNRKLQAQALRLRRRCRKSDVPRLLRLPGEKSPRIYQLIEKLGLTTDLGGRGVIPEPKTFDQAFAEALAVLQRNADANPNERRELQKKNMPKYPDMIEAAFRGEHAEARRKIGDRKSPHSKASEIAEDKVAEAAGISRPLVHQLCQEARDGYKSALKWAAARPGRGVALEPAITAAQLRQHLES